MAVHAKVRSSSAAAAVAGLAVWLLGRYVLHGRVDPVIQAEIYAAVPAVLSLAAGYLTPSPKPPAAAGKPAPPGTPAG